MNERSDYDVVVLGGAFSGAVTATLLKRWRPETRVLVVERERAFGRKVGEATVEISAFLLLHVLRMHDFLAREQLAKHGLRFWFTDGPERTLYEMSEIGPRSIPRVHTVQLDRAKLDEELLRQAELAGAEVLRPAKVSAVETGWPQTKVKIEVDGAEREVVTRWLVDASGRHAFLARRMGLLRRVSEHPTAAVWARFDGVKDLDGIEILGADPRQSKLPTVGAARRLATNHFMGRGWWCWMIPLAGGATSVGLVYNKEIFRWPGEGALREKFESFVRSQPGLRELLADASLDGEDFHSYAHLPYCSQQYMDRGWALVGDAAAFMDPYYSPGLDHASISSFATARLIEDELAGKLDDKGLFAAVADHNDRFLRSYQRWIRALYVGKYELFGDAELTSASFLMDTALYYMGVVSPIYRRMELLREPLFGAYILPVRISYRFMRFYAGRLQKLAAQRQRVGLYGRRNAGWRRLVSPADLGLRGGLRMFKAGAMLWLQAELSTAWARLRRRPAGAQVPAPASTRQETSPAAP